MRVLLAKSTYLSLSRDAVLRAKELKADWAQEIELEAAPREHYHLPEEVPRHDRVLLQVFDELGPWAMFRDSYGESDPNEEAPIVCIEIPDDTHYFVRSHLEEWIVEPHFIWCIDEKTGKGVRKPAESSFYTFTKDSVFTSLKDLK